MYTSPFSVSQVRRDEDATRAGSVGEERRPEDCRRASPEPGAAVTDSDRA